MAGSYFAPGQKGSSWVWADAGPGKTRLKVNPKARRLERMHGSLPPPFSRLEVTFALSGRPVPHNVVL
jgi:hypothetical protein